MNKLEIGVFFREFSAILPVKEQVFKNVVTDSPTNDYAITGMIEKDIVMPNGTISLADALGIELTSLSMLFIYSYQTDEIGNLTNDVLFQIQIIDAASIVAFSSNFLLWQNLNCDWEVNIIGVNLTNDPKRRLYIKAGTKQTL